MNLKKIFLIFTRELKSYFYSPIGYIVAAIYLILSQWNSLNRIFLFANQSLQIEQIKGSGIDIQGPITLNLDVYVIQPFFSFSCLVILFLFPAITMRLIAEEKRNNSFELLITSPINILDIVIGKYFAALTFILFLVAISFIILIPLFFFTNIDILPLLSGFLGVILFTASLIAFGIYASSLTDNSLGAFMIAFGGALFLFIINWLSFVNNPIITSLINYLSLIYHITSLIKGYLSVSDIIYFLSFIIFFIFLSYQKLEQTRWG